MSSSLGLLCLLARRVEIAHHHPLGLPRHYSQAHWGCRKQNRPSTGSCLTSERSVGSWIGYENQGPVGNGRARLKLGHSHGNLGLRSNVCRRLPLDLRVPAAASRVPKPKWNRYGDFWLSLSRTRGNDTQSWCRCRRVGRRLDQETKVRFAATVRAAKSARKKPFCPVMPLPCYQSSRTKHAFCDTCWTG
jgi:hypothetical protein